MATRKAGSRLETEIERCRSECQWERIPELVRQLSAKLLASGTRRARRPGLGGAAGSAGRAAARGQGRGRDRGRRGPGMGAGPGPRESGPPESRGGGAQRARAGAGAAEVRRAGGLPRTRGVGGPRGSGAGLGVLRSWRRRGEGAPCGPGRERAGAYRVCVWWAQGVRLYLQGSCE